MNVTSSTNVQTAVMSRNNVLKNKDQGTDAFAPDTGKGAAKPLPVEDDQNATVAKPAPAGSSLSATLFDVMAKTDAKGGQPGSDAVLGRTVPGDGKGLMALLAKMGKDAIPVETLGLKSPSIEGGNALNTQGRQVFAPGDNDGRKEVDGQSDIDETYDLLKTGRKELDADTPVLDQLKLLEDKAATASTDDNSLDLLKQLEEKLSEDNSKA